MVREEKDKLWYPSFADFEADHPHLADDAHVILKVFPGRYCFENYID